MFVFCIFVPFTIFLFSSTAREKLVSSNLKLFDSETLSVDLFLNSVNFKLFPAKSVSFTITSMTSTLADFSNSKAFCDNEFCNDIISCNFTLLEFSAKITSLLSES
ncbi:hypothetical protein EDEG_01904 [Edhazardia aedis USNM 41457]|uniref:Uncharacterized protein n=1 Tax=Edhazardia aedis (strain USNM 41457) TaxID=1003232 RepID=J9DR44_EDHAE|nr:hypothetical protein EDEG_01904 [Edhazardia aedis USNM 41457]|eukprot:EJW03812.1 hypothetical protein EDEG_01904 [Edhazardia aedis USNM 41457]